MGSLLTSSHGAETNQADPSITTSNHSAPQRLGRWPFDPPIPERIGPIQPAGLALKAAWSSSVPQVSSPQLRPSSVPHHQVLHQSRSIGRL